MRNATRGAILSPMTRIRSCALFALVLGVVAPPDAARALRGLVALSGLVVFFGLVAPVAEAAFPGRDGVIAFALNNSDRDGKGEIVTVSPSGRGRKTIYSEGYGGSGQLAPNYSSDGRLIVFETNGQGPLTIPSSGGDLQVMNSDGSALHSIPSQGEAAAPAWGPNGRSIVYSYRANLFTVDLFNGTFTQITTIGASQPAWSVRNQIAYVHAGDIYIMSASGGLARRLTFNGGAQPAFFAGGGRIAFVRNVAGRGQIFTVNTDATHMRQITHMRRRSTSPAVAPDGRFIAFIHDDGPSENTANTDHLWVMQADGRQAHQIRHLPGDDFGLLQAEHPNWQPLPR